MGRWSEDDFYSGRITELFAHLDTVQKDIICKVAEQMAIDNDKAKHSDVNDKKC